MRIMRSGTKGGERDQVKKGELKELVSASWKWRRESVESRRPWEDDRAMPALAMAELAALKKEK